MPGHPNSNPLYRRLAGRDTRSYAQQFFGTQVLWRPFVDWLAAGFPAEELVTSGLQPLHEEPLYRWIHDTGDPYCTLRRQQLWLAYDAALLTAGLMPDSGRDAETVVRLCVDWGPRYAKMNELFGRIASQLETLANRPTSGELPV